MRESEQMVTQYTNRPTHTSLPLLPIPEAHCCRPKDCLLPSLSTIIKFQLSISYLFICLGVNNHNQLVCILKNPWIILLLPPQWTPKALLWVVEENARSDDGWYYKSSFWSDTLLCGIYVEVLLTKKQNYHQIVHTQNSIYMWKRGRYLSCKYLR